MASIDASRAGAQVLPFYLAGDTGEAALVRGRFATIGAPVTQILSRHGYPDAVAALQAAGCEDIRGDEAARGLSAELSPASAEDWDTEYLDSILSVRIVDDLDAAISHVNRHGSHHTEAIITADAEAAARFQREVDAAIVMHNASTQFADGGEFGMGAEIGIATGRMHARGPVGAAQLTSYKYVVEGSGQTRP